MGGVKRDEAIVLSKQVRRIAYERASENYTKPNFYQAALDLGCREEVAEDYAEVLNNRMRRANPDPITLFLGLLRLCVPVLAAAKPGRLSTMPDGRTPIVDAVRKALREHAE